MSSNVPQPYVALPNSERKPVPGAQESGTLDPNELVEVSIYLRPKSPLPAPAEADQTMTREQYAAAYGADQADVDKIVAFARDHGLNVVQTDLARRVVVLSGTVAAVTAAFQVELRRYTHEGKVFRGRTGTIQVPQDIAPLIEAVLGIDNRDQARPHMRLARTGASTLRPQTATAAGFTSAAIARLYDFPTAGNGQGETIGIIELGGGYRVQDLDAYFAKLNIKPPAVASVSVDSDTNTPSGDPGSADGEVALDIEVAGAVAPGAQIAVYFAPNSDQGFIDAISTAVHDTRYRPSVLSISWGGPEVSWTSQATQLMDQVFQQAATLGVTICVAAGDSGSDDGVGDGSAHVDFPASSPYVLGCGGTYLEASGTTIASETVWNDGGGATGGGVSDLFPVPSWQQQAHVPSSVNDGHAGRGVPDVAGDADPQSGYAVLVDGQDAVVGGTSAVAPLYAGLIALINQQLGKPVGFLNPFLYQNSRVFRDITSGTNALNGAPGYSAGPGWDASTGLGVVNGARLLDALRAR
jgi:kumamolisin